MKIIMLGAPGAGKGTQAKKIAAKYAIPHISTGDIFRANIKNNTELGQKAKTYMDKGELVPDELVVDLIMDRFKEADCANGYVLDGFPRTIPQAEALDKALSANGESVDYAVNVEVPDENIINRMSGRRACVGCGATYHIQFNPTKVEGICDACGEKLILRDDDQPETLECGTMNGAILDNYVVAEIRKTYLNCGKEPYLYYYRDKDAREIDIVLEHDGILNPIEIKKTANPGTELVKVFELLDKASTPRAKGAVICMKPGLSAIDRDNYIVPVWMI